MQRREFLKLSVLFAFATACRSAMITNDEPTETILIIGAGMAGLSAARQLHDAGQRVIVLEGRSRIGGRVWTNHTWEDAPVDLGASWIHGQSGNPLTSLADEIGLARLVTDYENAVLYDTDGEAISDAAWTELAERFDALLVSVADVATDEMTLHDAIEQSALWQAASPLEQQQLLYMVNTMIEHEFSGSLRELSASNYDDTEVYEGEDVIFPNGYGQICDYLARDLDIQFEQVVERIIYTEEGVQVQSNQATFEADRVIVTLPVGVLKGGDVQFEPPLPTDKQAAIETMGVGLLDKLFLQFPTVFWDEEAEIIDRVSAEYGRWSEWLNLYAYTGQPILLGFNAADYARQLSSWQDDAVVADAMDVLRTLYGGDIPDPISWQRSNWLDDPFARGSYSFNAVGASRSTRMSLTEPIGERLFFAGEATSVDYPSTVHGAYLSGQAAATAILGKTYSAETDRLLTQAKALYARKQAAGYTRADAIDDFNSARAQMREGK